MCSIEKNKAGTIETMVGWGFNFESCGQQGFMET